MKYQFPVENMTVSMGYKTFIIAGGLCDLDPDDPDARELIKTHNGQPAPATKPKATKPAEKEAE